MADEKDPFANVEFDDPEVVSPISSDPFADVTFETPQVVDLEAFDSVDFPESLDSTKDQNKDFSILDTLDQITSINSVELAMTVANQEARNETEAERTAFKIDRNNRRDIRIKRFRAAGEELISLVPTETARRKVQAVYENNPVITVPANMAEWVGGMYSDLTGGDRDDNPLYQFGRIFNDSINLKDVNGDPTFTDDVVGAVTQGIGFVVGGQKISALLGGGKKAAIAASAWLGANMGGNQGRRDAEAAGATPEQVALAFRLDSIIGTSEALPVGIIINKLDDISGGMLSKKLKSALAQKIGGGVQSALVEFIQEGSQTMAENFVASDLAGYDPSRTLTENATHAAQVGGNTGFLFGLVAMSLNIEKRNRFKRDILEPLGLETEEDLIQFNSMAEDYFNLIQAQETMLGELDVDQADQDILETRFRLTLDEFRKDNPDSVPMVGTETRQILNKDDSIRITDEEQTGALVAATQVNETLEGGKALVAERVKLTPVTLALTQKAEQNAKIKISLDEAIVREEALLTSDVIGKTRTDLELSIQVNKDLKAQIEQVEKTELDIAKEIKSRIAKSMKHLPAGTKVLVENHILDKTNAKEANNGRAYVMKIGGTQVNVISIRLNRLHEARAALDANPGDAHYQKLFNNAKAKVVSTTMHEFGHMMVYEHFAEMNKRIATGKASRSDQIVFAALQKDYMTWVVNNLNGNIRDLTMSRFTIPAAASLAHRSMGEKEGNFDSDIERLSHKVFETKTGEVFDNDFVDYLFGFHEWAAENIAMVHQEQDIEGPTSEYFKEAAKSLAAVRNVFASGEFAPAQSIDKFFVLNSMEGRIAELKEKLGANNDIRQQLVGLVDAGLLEDHGPLDNQLDRFNKFMDVGFNILQIAQLNPHIAGLQGYVDTLRLWKNSINNTLAVAESRLVKWKNLDNKKRTNLARLMYDETIGHLPDGGWLKDPRKFTYEEVAAYKLGDEALSLRTEIQSDFADSLNRMEEVLVAQKRRIFKGPEQITEIAKIQKEFRELRNKPYFPLMRFGEFTFQMRSVGSQTLNGTNYKDGETIDFQAFDTKQERDKAQRDLQRKNGIKNFSFSASKMVNPNFSLQGMPLTLIEHLESIMPSMTEEQRKAFAQVKNDVLPFKSFRKQFQRRKKTQGFSLDAQRSYANYMSSFANHIARIEYDPIFKENLASVEDSIKEIKRTHGTNTDKRVQIMNHMNDHIAYVMNPVDEFVAIRSAAFAWYLGFNVKSAFVNLTQIPLVTYPYLAARYGDGRALAQLTRAYGTATKLFTNPDKVDEGIKAMVERGINESWLDESLATELALAASEKNLDKSLPRNVRQRIALGISHYGSMPFHVAEKFNRHVTGIAAYRLAKSKGKSQEEAVIEARSAVEKSQFEYARWARPRFMRGKLGGTVFVFQNYMQNALFFALGGDPGALRMNLMLLMLAGIMGLPGAENIADLVDAGMTVMKKKFGMKDPHTQIRVDAREFLKGLNVDPDLVLHGASSSSFGLANLGEFMGWPIPDIDLSGSLSMGRIIPGTDTIQVGQGLSANDRIAGVLGRAGGAVVSGGVGINTALTNSHPDQWKRWEKAMPAAMRGISKGARFQVRGEEATRSGYPIAEFDMTDPRDKLEAAMQMLSFTPRDVSKGWEGFIAKQQAITYYETWKSLSLLNWNVAKDNKDVEAVKEANAGIRRYNSGVPYPEMKIGSETRTRSYESYLKIRQYNKRQIEQSISGRRLSTDIQKIFDEEDTPNKGQEP